MAKLRPNLRYALTLIHANDTISGHAILEDDGKYYDPTLEPQTGLMEITRYELVEILDREEMIEMINKHHGGDAFQKMKMAQMEWSRFSIDDTGQRDFDL